MLSTSGNTDATSLGGARALIFALQRSWSLLFRDQPVPRFDDTDTAVRVVAKF